MDLNPCYALVLYENSGLEPQARLYAVTGCGHDMNLCNSILHDTNGFYPRDAMLARVFATATCLSVCLSVRHTPVLCLAERKQDREMYTV